MSRITKPRNEQRCGKVLGVLLLDGNIVDKGNVGHIDLNKLSSVGSAYLVVADVRGPRPGSSSLIGQR